MGAGTSELSMRCAAKPGYRSEQCHMVLQKIVSYTFFTIPGQVEQKEPVEVPPADPKSSLKIQKRGQSGSTPNLKQTDSKPVVTNEKRHSLAASTFPRMSTPNKQQQDLAGETNGLVTLPRKGNHGCIHCMIAISYYYNYFGS